MEVLEKLEAISVEKRQDYWSGIDDDDITEGFSYATHEEGLAQSLKCNLDSLPVTTKSPKKKTKTVKSGSIDAISEGRLAGINVFVGRQGESCDSACKSRGQACVTSKLSALNQCESIKKFMSCKGGCISSIGPDQPAEVVEDAPKHLHPGACLYTKTKTMLTCDGFHQHTRRLCPCT